SFRNEITVEHFTFRSCEFEQMEMEFFVPPPQYAEEGKDDMYWYNYWCEQRMNWYTSLGIRKEKLRLRAHESSELAHYAKACADRATLAFLLDAYVEEPPPPGTNEGRTVLRLHPRLAPTKVAVFPLVKKDGMPEAARSIVEKFFKQQIKAVYDEKDAIGRRYR